MHEDGVGNAGRGGARQTRRLRPVADDDDNLGGIGRIGTGVDQRLQVRPAAGDQHAQPHSRHRNPVIASASADRWWCRREICCMTARPRLRSRENTGSETVCNGSAAGVGERRRSGRPAPGCRPAADLPRGDADDIGTRRGPGSGLLRDGQGRCYRRQRRRGPGARTHRRPKARTCSGNRAIVGLRGRGETAKAGR